MANWFKTRMSKQFDSTPGTFEGIGSWKKRMAANNTAVANAAHNAGADSDPWSTGTMSWERGGKVTNDKYFK